MIEPCLPSMKYQISMIEVLSDHCQVCAYVAGNVSHCNKAGVSGKVLDASGVLSVASDKFGTLSVVPNFV